MDDGDGDGDDDGGDDNGDGNGDGDDDHRELGGIVGEDIYKEVAGCGGPLQANSEILIKKIISDFDFSVTNTSCHRHYLYGDQRRPEGIRH